jgi:dihydroxy-acid dehydratase
MLDVEARRLELLIDDAELQSRLAAWKAVPQRKIAARGYARLFEECVLQADQGCDFNFLLRQAED